MLEQLRWKKFHPLSDKNAFICLVDVMGDDNAIVQAARSSYDGFAQGVKVSDKTKKEFKSLLVNDIESLQLTKTSDLSVIWSSDKREDTFEPTHNTYELLLKVYVEQLAEDRHLTRYLMNHSHTTPFEMVELKFMVQVPMDCWRQWIRHRTANVNEYSTRYTEALDFFQVTQPQEWRLQSKDNKQGSSGFLTDWPEGVYRVDHADGTGTVFEPFDRKSHPTPGSYLSEQESELHYRSLRIYQERLALGIAKEQARKDLPLSTYTRAYWKCDLHNIFNFLRLRMDNHAQQEIRFFANSMFEIVKQICPVACEAFEDYVLHAKKFSRMEMEFIRRIRPFINNEDKPSNMTNREWKEFLAKLS